MRWAEVFKINSDMAKPLNTLINEFNTWITGQVQGTNNNVTNQHAATNTKVDNVYNLVNRGAVKSVQHGSTSKKLYGTDKNTSAPSYYDLNIAPVNMNKSIVICYGNEISERFWSGTTSAVTFSARCDLVSNSTIRIYATYYYSAYSNEYDNYKNYECRYTVVEFY